MRLNVSIIYLMLGMLAVTQTNGTATAQDIELVNNGNSVAKVYVHPDEMQTVKRIKFYTMLERPSEISVAVKDLVYHIEQMSGATLEVVETANAKDVPKPALVIGKLAQDLGATVEKTKWQEGYHLQTHDGRVLVLGERDIATSYGVYALLYELGCDWVLPGPLGEVIPEKKTVTVNRLDVAANPDFGMRHMWIGGSPKNTKYYLPEKRAEFETWVDRQRFGASDEFDERRNEAHMWNKLIREYKEEFAANPEMFALVKNPDGTYERRGPQIETENPDTVQIAARHFRDTFKKKGWPNDIDITLAIGPADGIDFSESPESRAAGTDRRHPISGEKDYSDVTVKFANDVLAVIGDEFPNLKLGFYVYSTHNRFPAKYELNPRLRPIFAPISYSRFHSTLDPHSKTRAFYSHIVDDYAKWAKEHDVPLVVYEYNWNLADNLLPYTRVRSVAEDVAYYHEKGVRGFTMQALRVFATSAPHDYIYARMLWDASLDWRELLSEYCNKAYGPAGEDVKRYLLRIADQQQRAGYEAGSYYSTSLIFDEAFVSDARGDLDAALAHNNLTEKQRGRVQAVEFGFNSLDLYLKWKKQTNKFEFAKAMETGGQLRSNYNKAVETDQHFYDRAGGIYIDRLMLKSTEGQLKYSTDPYKIVYKVPDALPTMFDPTNDGEQMNLYSTKINDSRWLKTHTFSSTWDAQGLGLLRDGSVWYRTRFDLPSDLKGQSVGILLGAFEDEAKVWVNGAYVGSTGIAFPRAVALDVSDGVLVGQENQLTIKVRRNSKANELLLGGLLRPSFVFVGPKVETPEPPKHRVRVLPGGDLEIIKEKESE